MEKTLRVKAFEIQGRKAVLTPTGQMLYQRARTLLEDAASLERAAAKASAGWEAEISIAVEVLFPMWLMLDCLARFGRDSPQTRVEVFETVLGGTTETLQSGIVDFAIAPTVPADRTGELLTTANFLLVAHPDHPLHQLGRDVTPRDLRKYRHLVVRDSGSRRTKDVQTVEVAQRWTVTNMATSIGAAIRGYGFAWLPQDKIREELERGQLKPLPLRGGSGRSAPLYLIFADRDAAGPGALRLAQIVREAVAQQCLTLTQSRSSALPPPSPRRQ